MGRHHGEVSAFTNDTKDWAVRGFSTVANGQKRINIKEMMISQNAVSLVIHVYPLIHPVVAPARWTTTPIMPG